jgi:hypothetical protein
VCRLELVLDESTHKLTVAPLLTLPNPPRSEAMMKTASPPPCLTVVVAQASKKTSVRVARCAGSSVASVVAAGRSPRGMHANASKVGRWCEAI